MRWLIAWILFWCGDLVSKTLWWEWTGARLYPVYNRLMVWAFEIQKDGPGPWKSPEK